VHAFFIADKEKNLFNCEHAPLKTMTAGWNSGRPSTASRSQAKPVLKANTDLPCGLVSVPG
jgi:hypothetical protein